MIGILGAMDLEVRTLIERIEGARERSFGAFSFTCGTLSGREVAVAQCGVGKVNAAICAQTLILALKPQLIVNIGVAGALAADLSIGDLVIAESVVHHDADTSSLGDPIGMVSTVNRVYFPCDESAREALLSAARGAGFAARAGRVASGDQFVCDPARKQWILKTFSAHVCEMEAGAIAQTCFVNNVPCAIVRAVSDRADGCASVDFRQFVGQSAEQAMALMSAFLRAGCD